MAKLYSYCIPFDEGGAPNPFWGICTLNICKPVIRRVAKVGDWIVGTGSKQFGFENKVVYAMEVTQKMTMQEYESFCKQNLPQKIPNWNSQNYKERVGDCIYEFTSNSPIIIDSVHNINNMPTDLGGQHTLLSNHFYYFGDNPELLPEFLLPIVKQNQGHKSASNAPYVELFIDWISIQTKAKNQIYSEPNARHLFMNDKEYRDSCGSRNKCNDELDEKIGDDSYC